MRYAVLSDVHANEEALKRVLGDVAQMEVGQIVCLGDVVGYGPLPREAVSLVRSAANVTLAGNHDDAVSGRMEATAFIDLAKDAVARHRAALSSEDLAWLKALPYTCRFGRAVAAHGDFTDPAKFYYVNDETDAEANFRVTEAPLLFTGHTHEPALFVTGASGQVHRCDVQDFMLEEGKRYLVNPGSVGYPREKGGVCRSSYVIYDDETGAVMFRFLPFAVSSVMQRGAAKRRCLPVLLVCAAAVLIAAAAAFGLARRQRTVVKEVEVEKVVREAEDPSLLLARKDLTIGESCHAVRAQLEVTGDNVTLRIVFRDANGRPLKEAGPFAGRHFPKKKFAVPPGAVSASFIVTKLAPRSSAEIVRFEPAGCR